MVVQQVRLWRDEPQMRFSQMLVLYSDPGIMRYLQRCPGESEVSVWGGKADYDLERRPNILLGEWESMALYHLFCRCGDKNPPIDGTGSMQ